MKKKTIWLSILCMILVFSGCFSKKENIFPNYAMNDKIKVYIEEHSQLVLDEMVDTWDYVLIDTAYHAMSAFEKLEIANKDRIKDIPYEDDVKVLAFICNDKVVTYTLIHSSDEEASSLLDNYVYQLSGKTYPKGTVFEKKPLCII